ncbi:MAG: hypothetical protein P4K83_00045 [Terracidiphilus sp.]|nr:hypothetical protein [Terracidiphilus sp.]
MPDFGKDLAVVTQFIRNLRGSSQSILAQASDGHTYVVKFANNLKESNLLFNESAGSVLYRACGLPVPEWRPLVVSEAFLDKNPGCWMETPEGCIQPASGLCFGSRYLGESGKRIFEILPGSSFSRIRNRTDFWLAWLIDICAEHSDNRQAIFVEDADGWLDSYFVDYGHLFGGPNADQKKNFRASRYLDARIYVEVALQTLQEIKNVVQTLNADSLRQEIEAIPAEWKHVSALDGFERCIQRLSEPFLVQNILDTMVDAIERRSESENPGNERKLPSEVLRFGVWGAGAEQSLVYHSACA